MQLASSLLSGQSSERSQRLSFEMQSPLLHVNWSWPQEVSRSIGWKYMYVDPEVSRRERERHFDKLKIVQLL